MAKDPQLVPVFMPPLAALLARAEQLKGSPLTETEVARIRDAAPCVTMQPADAAKLLETRGYRDVNPENCWADWHRLRAELTGGYLPKIVLCIPGGQTFPQKCEPILADAGNQHEWRKREKGMTEAFAASEFRLRPSLSDEDRASIEKHKSVLYALSSNFPSGRAATVSQSMLELGRRLLEAGGSAIKCESSGIAHGRSQWIEFANQVENAKDASTRWSALFDAFVQFPIRFEKDFYTCGMHLLGKPDLIVDVDLSPAADCVELFTTFALYLLAECPDGAFASGHTFRASKKALRYRVAWEPCTGYDEDDFFFNPFGRWRFTPAGSKP